MNLYCLAITLASCHAPPHVLRCESCSRITGLPIGGGALRTLTYVGMSHSLALQEYRSNN